MISHNYDDWKDCTENKYCIKLTKDFITLRIGILSDKSVADTQHFIQLYGINHYNNAINWLKQAEKRIQQTV